MTDISTELDSVIPRHQLLDNTAAKHRTDLIHRGTLASRHKPSGEALKCQILKRQHFLSKDNSPAPRETSTPPPTPASPLVLPPAPPPAPPVAPPAPPPPPSVPEPERTATKPSKVSLIADLQSAQKTRRGKEDSPESPERSEESSSPATDELEKNQTNKQKVPFLVELENSKNKGKLKSTKTKRVDPSPPKKMESFGIQDQLRLKLEARKKLVEEAEEAEESQS